MRIQFFLILCFSRKQFIAKSRRSESVNIVVGLIQFVLYEIDNDYQDRPMCDDVMNGLFQNQASKISLLYQYKTVCVIIEKLLWMEESMP